MFEETEKEIEILHSKIEAVIARSYILTFQNENLNRENEELKKKVKEQEDIIIRLELFQKSSKLAAELGTPVQKEALKNQISALIEDIEYCMRELRLDKSV